MAFLPCVKKVAVIIQFVHLADTSSICMHVCHVHMMCVWVCYVFSYTQQSPKWSLTTTLYLSHTLSTCGPSSPLILNTNSSSMSLQWNAPLQPDYVITAYTLPHRVPSLKSQSEMWAPPSTVGAWLHSAGTCSFVVLLTRPQSYSIPTTYPSGILFYQINSVVTDFLGVKLHGGLPWLIFDVGSGPAVVGSNSTRTFNNGQWHTVSFRTHRSC